MVLMSQVEKLKLQFYLCVLLFIYAFQIYSFNTCISSLLGIDCAFHKTPLHIVLSSILCPILSMHNGNIYITPALFTHSNVRLCGG